MNHRLFAIVFVFSILAGPLQCRAEIPGLDGDQQQAILDQQKDLVFGDDGPMSLINKDSGGSKKSLSDYYNKDDEDNDSDSDVKYQYRKKKVNPKELVPRSFPYF